MSQVVSSFAAPGEPRPPVIGEEARHARSEGFDQPLKRVVTMETYDGQDEYLKPPPGWESGGDGAEGGPSPPYTAASTPPYLRWAGGLRSLLDDEEGVEHFKKYLNEEGCPEMLDFWFACKGLTGQSPDRPEHDPVQFRRTHLGHIQAVCAAAAARARRARAGRAARERGRALGDRRARARRPAGRAPVCRRAGAGGGADEPHRVRELPQVGLLHPAGAGLADLRRGRRGEPGGLQLRQQRLRPAADKRALIQPTGRRKPDKAAAARTGLSMYQQPGLPLPRPVNPYHTLYSSYNPVSRQDSELQSKSSEALTDDTCSRAGSSVDGRTGQYPTWHSQRRVTKRQHRLMKDSARQNQESSLQHPVIPRTERVVELPLNPSWHVQEFAQLLTSKLERVILEREMMESGVDSKRLLQDAIGKLGKLAVENEQEILDAHISKVFDSSHHTPWRSGARSPAPRDVLSTFSADSGTVQDLAASQLSLERHQRHHMPKSRTFPDYAARRSLQDPDSGVSVVSTDRLPVRTRPNEKVMMWMQQAGKDESYNTSRSGSLDRAAEEERRGRARLSEGGQQPQAAPYNSLKRHVARQPKPGQARPDADDMLCVAYTFCGEEVPYRTRIAAKRITLKQFKQLMPRKGNYRYFFKTECRDFETGVIQEEVTDEAAVLPLWEGKVFGQVMSRD
ncbi:axin-like [Pollicipes pollicipes]|uniref:axin-like n=1 Tax=Pollicipes pollicipes TaxID=41117 RepID=UPI001885720F|nr:axin-like [Pollicipes pollicipes]